MRVLVVGSYKRWRMESGVARALIRAGHEVKLLDDRRMKRIMGRRMTQWWTRRAVGRFKPETVILGKCLGLDLETVAEIVRGRRSRMWNLDGPWYGKERPEQAHIDGVGKLVDVCFVNGFEESWRARGVPARFLPAAADREIMPTMPDPAYRSDVAFTGTGYDEARAAFLMEVAKHCQLRVWGLGWERWREQLNWSGRPVEDVAFSKVCSSTSIMLGALPAPMKVATLSASNRMWITILAGGFFLGAHTPGIDRLLKGGEHCAWYRDLNDCIAKIKYYLGYPKEREKIRLAGLKYVREHHTFDQRIEHLLSGKPYISPLDRPRTIAESSE